MSEKILLFMTLAMLMIASFVSGTAITQPGCTRGSMLAGILVEAIIIVMLWFLIGSGAVGFITVANGA